MVSSGSDIKTYRNLNNGYLTATPIHTVNAIAKKILLTQMNRMIFDTNPIPDKLDLVSISGNTISIRYNSNNDQFDTLQTVTTESNIWDIAVGDLNNDSWNDVLVTYEAGKSKSWLQVFLGDAQGRLSATPTYTYEVPPGIYWDGIVTITDMGSPIGMGGGARNDGWNDIIFAGYYGPILIFINTHQTPFFGPSPTQTIMGIVSSAEYLRQIKVADIQNTGGHSLVCVNGGGEDHGIYVPGAIYLYKHTGDPAPAPPQGVQVTAVAREFGYADALVTWRPNSERDLANYKLYRRITGVCGNGNWYVLATLNSFQTQYLDELTTVGPGDCLAEYKLTAIDGANNESDYSATVEIEFSGSMWKGNAGGRNTPKEFGLHPASPNPFNPSTEIKFDLPEDSFVSLNVFDVLGRKVGEIANGNYTAGYHSATWNPSTSSGQVLASGVYFARFTAKDASGAVKLTKINKLVLTK